MGKLRSRFVELPINTPPPTAFTPAERRLIAKLRSPAQVQDFLNRLPYNTEPPPKRDTLRSFRQVLRRKTAHCLEAALVAACVLEQHGYPPLLMSLESADGLDHVIFIYRRRGRWGSVARSRDPGLHGRKPVFASPRALAESYCEPYIDYTGRLTGYGFVDLRVMGGYDWRFSRKNVWAVERMLLQLPHRKIRRSRRRTLQWRRKYIEYMERYGKKPLFYRGRDKWTAVPAHFL
jgi:hypothetical protein